ncbi:MAG: SH3 domain-containing protein [Clostridia bacterium]
MKKRILFLALLLVMLTMLPTLAMADTLWVNTPNAKSVNLRMGPSMDDAVLVRVPYGEPVEVIYDFVGSSYFHCQYQQYDGYIQASYLSDFRPDTPRPFPQPTKRPGPKPTRNPDHANPTVKSISYNKFQPELYLATVVPSNPSSFVNMRWAPDKSVKVQDIYYNAQTLLVIAENGTWSQVYDLENHKSGFMMSSFLRYYAAYDEGSYGFGAPSPLVEN